MLGEMLHKGKHGSTLSGWPLKSSEDTECPALAGGGSGGWSMERLQNGREGLHVSLWR